ncbi:hypothetical protein FBY04_12775 [Pseudomonas sp. SJZ080]|uniref:hypothetical protein n=1 Tax=unclassified Pseudomonas TaxID=196821 RepID=UPI00119C2C19|nr:MULTISPECIES: hypothetical protein [unclassified Pseudomonas]MBB6155464.1 hypothetical protein [Pseudomonas sp. JAI115]TWC47711.1 hypothetical protein FBY04_12775 [Pseudomonas sp. SJZ080]
MGLLGKRSSAMKYLPLYVGPRSYRVEGLEPSAADFRPVQWSRFAQTHNPSGHTRGQTGMKPFKVMIVDHRMPKVMNHATNDFFHSFQAVRR